MMIGWYIDRKVSAEILNERLEHSRCSTYVVDQYDTALACQGAVPKPNDFDYYIEYKLIVSVVYLAKHESLFEKYGVVDTSKMCGDILRLLECSDPAEFLELAKRNENFTPFGSSFELLLADMNLEEFTLVDLLKRSLAGENAG